MGARRTIARYREFDPVTIPFDVPGTEVRAGDTGTIVDMYGSTAFLVEVMDSEGYTLAHVEMESEPELRVVRAI